LAGAAEPNSTGVPANGLTVDPNVGQVDPTGTKITFVAFQKDSNIRDGLRLLAALCKKNIVPTGGVDGPLTVSRLYDVTFEEALDAILGFGFRYEQVGDFVRVYTAEQYKKMREDPERMVFKVITLYYLTADEAVKLVTPVLSGSASARVQATTAAENSISGGEGSLGGGSGGGNTPANQDMIVVFDYPENVKRAEAVLGEVDTRPQQVLIEATIMSARLTEENKFGIDWNLLGGTAITGFPATINGYGTKAQTSQFAATPGGKGLTVGFSADNVQAIITALETVTDTTVLANPKILAVNKQEGVVYIGRKIGYVDTTTQNQSGSTTQSASFLETGTRLAFRPYIGNDGYIRMDIYPKDSDGTLKSNGIPDETTTELKTNVVVKDGQTVVIGGLFRDNIVKSKSQVPLLGNLPVVGALFRGQTDTVGREEVIIILTPHIIDEPGEVRGDDRASDIRRKRGAALDSLQATDSAKWAEEAYASAARYYLEGDLEKAVFNLKLALMIRPTYLEALRLRERIIAETDPEQFRRLDSIATEEVDGQQVGNWSRR
jgi:type II secretory pathway component GspD/PulD (secretin)